MKKFLISLLLASVFIPVVLAEGIVMQPGSYMAEKNVNVRLLPKAGSHRIDHLHKGQEIKVKRVVKGWCEIEYKKYWHAYVDCSFLEAAGASGKDVQKVSEYADFNGVAVGKTQDLNWTLGSPDAKVVMEEFSDMQCPYCAYYFVNTFPEIFKNYIATGKVKYVFYNFPLAFHEHSSDAAGAAYCAGGQGKFWQMHEKIMENQDQWSLSDRFKEIMLGYAAELGLDPNVFDACIAGDFSKEQIYTDVTVGFKKGVAGTPTFFVNGQQITGAVPYETFAEAIDAALTEK